MLFYDEFIKLIEDKKFDNLDFTDIKIQTFFVYYLINKNNEIDNSTIINKFNSIAKYEFKVSRSNISKIRKKLTDNCKGNDIYELIKKLKLQIPNLIVNVHDISYEIKIKKQAETRTQRIIYFGTKDRLEKLNNKICEEFFADVTFQIIPKKMRPYKLLIISGIAKGEIKATSLCFVLIKYIDSVSYGRVFNYLFENYNFLPKILQTNYEKTLKKAINDNIYFKNITYNSHCFFHFA